MAGELHRPGHQLSLKAASAINPRTPVQIIGSNEPLVIPAASVNVRPFGVTGAATAGASGLLSGEFVTVYEEGNIVRARAAVSLGVGAEIGLASDNGGLGPVSAASLGASGVQKWSVGQSLSPAGAGEVFSLYVKPRLIGGLA